MKKRIGVFASGYKRRRKRKFGFPTRNQIPDSRILHSDTLSERLSKANELSTSFIDSAKVFLLLKKRVKVSLHVIKNSTMQNVESVN